MAGKRLRLKICTKLKVSASIKHFCKKSTTTQSRKTTYVILQKIIHETKFIMTLFYLIYQQITKNIDTNVLALIDSITNTYNENDKIIVEQWFTVIYAGMIAEENKRFSILKKRVKRLGMHQVLKLNMSAKDAAKFSYEKKWKELDEIMKPLGF